MTTAARFAFYGRVSTDDAQDPSLSIPRQLAACKRAIAPGGGQVVVSYWDVESGRNWLDERGTGDGAGLGVSVLREGGLTDLLDAARRDAFDAVIVESIDRLSRMTADATQVERELEQRDIGLFAADEPLAANATAILTRRVKQGVSEWYVRDLVEKSRRGMEQSVIQGWHTGGRVPYGYRLEEHPHPNPHKARDGKKKHRLVPDPVRAPIVLEVFEDYCLDGRGLGEICDKLNRDLDRYPPPKRNRKDEMALPQTWSRSQIWAMLRNPKYTGYNVWGRHDKRRGRPFIRPREQWTWSPTRTHEPLVPKQLFDRVEERAGRNEARATHPPLDYPRRRGRRKGRLYPLRGRVCCALCGRRMEGTHQRRANWYRCRFEANRGTVAAEVAGHPRALQIKEDVILDHLLEFMGRRLFGPDRLRLLRDDLAHFIAEGWREHDTQLAQLRHELEALDRSLYRQSLRLEEHDDPHHPVVAVATRRIEELSARQTSIEDAIRTLEARRPGGARPAEIEAILAAVPDLRPSLKAARPEELVELFEAFDVRAVYDKPSRTLELAATVTPELVPEADNPRRSDAPSGISSIAGAGFEPATFGL